MANKSKRIGTEGENWWLREFVTKVWPGSDRAKAGNPGNDYHGPPIPVEAKRQATWLIPSWTRYLRALHGDRWVLLVAARDRRRADAPPDIVVLPVGFALEVLSTWEKHRARP